MFEVFDLAFVEKEKVYALSNIVDDSVDILQLFDEPKKIREKIFTITEITTFRFHYPYMAMVKGGNEFFLYDFTKALYGYCQFNSPIIAVTGTQSLKSIISFHVIFDVGPYLVYGELVAKDSDDLVFTFSNRFIEKTSLVPEKILTFYDPIDCKWDGFKDTEPGLILHSVNNIYQINLIRHNVIAKLEEKIREGDILNLNGCGLIIGKKGELDILHAPVPINVSQIDKFNKVYTCSNPILSITCHFEARNPYIYLCESEKFLKKCEMLRNDSTTLKIDSEIFVDEAFTGREIFGINKGMLYIKQKGIVLQTKDPDGADVDTDEKFDPPLNLDGSTIDNEFPLISQDVLLFSGKVISKSQVFKAARALIMPTYRSPLFRLLPLEQSKYLRNEFYYYPKSINQEYVVYRLNRTDIQCIEFAFYKPNGRYDSSLRLKIHGIKDYNYVNLVVSPNGRYIFYAEVNDKYDVNQAKDLSEDGNRRFTLKTTKIVGRVAEIVTMRPKRDIEKVNRLLNKKTIKGDNNRDMMERIGQQIDINDITFCLKPIRSVPDVGNTLNLYDDPNIDEQNETSRIHITNNGDVVFIDKISKFVFFNDINIYEK